MKYSLRSGLLWLSLFVILALTPMAIALIGERPEPRGFWVELGVALGFIGLSTMALQMVFSGRLQSIAPIYGMDNILQFHREIGIIALFFVLAHPLVLVIADPYFLIFYDPTVNFPRAVSLGFVTVAAIGITVTSIWRQAFKLSYEWWRLIHGVLAFLIVLIGITHSIQVSHYFEPLWKKSAIALLIGACAYLVIHTRCVRPWLNSKWIYRVKKIVEERGNSYTMILEPDGFERMSFEPGQFVWMSVGAEALKMQQHPFSIVSSDQDPNVALTAKVLGDFTGTWPEIREGTPVALEGPFGSFTLKGEDPVFMVMGGIGVTPGMSILRSLIDRGDEREIILVYGNPDWESITFREELEEVEQLPHVKVIHVLTDPPSGWSGETGYVDQELLERHLPDRKNEFTYYVCGPKPMMDTVETSLRELGIDWKRIYSERFEIV